MPSEHLSDAQIRAAGWQALIDRLGPAGALRFSMQTESGWGDYSKLRHRQLGSLSVDELVARVKASSAGRKPRRSR